MRGNDKKEAGMTSKMEKRLGKSIVSKNNYLKSRQNKKLLKDINSFIIKKSFRFLYSFIPRGKTRVDTIL